MKKLFLAVAVFVVLAVSKDMFAQQNVVSATITAKGTVNQHITAQGTRALDFGADLIGGVPTSVDKASSNSGKFEITGKAGREISIDFDLPSNLTDGTGNNLAISFSSTDAGYINNGSTLNAFNPSSGTNANMSATGTMEVYLGGTVSPTPNQVPGYYSGTVQINLQYTTN